MESREPQFGADSSQPEIPAALAAALRRAESVESLSGGELPDFHELDTRVMAAASAHLRQRRLRHLLFRSGAGLAAAATLALACWVGWNFWAPARSAPDLSRAVTIVDALHLAQLLEKHDRAISPAWDMNSDGLVDQRDVDVIAHRAVHLGAGGGA